jgi:hypothetical protein
MRWLPSRALQCAVFALTAVVALAGHVTPAGAGTIVTPSGGTFVVPSDADGRPQPFTIDASGFAPGSSVIVEQCDGTAPTAVGWTPNEHCDSASAPASVTVGADGVARFPKGDRNFGFTPFTGSSPQKLFNCLAPGEASPHNGQPDFTNCQVRVGTSTINSTSDQAFVVIRVPALRPGASAIAPTTTANKGTNARAGAPSTPTTTRARGAAVRKGLAEAKAAGDVKSPTMAVQAGGGSVSSRSTAGDVWHGVTSAPGVILLVLVIALAVGAARRRPAPR